MTFGRLTAKEIVCVDKRKGVIWRCECSCGGEKEVPAAYLLNKKTQSGGCITKEIQEQSMIKGQRFGLLEAIRFDHTDEKKRTYWLFQCECGNQKVLPVNSVKWSGVRSCGCLAEKHITELNRQDITNERFDRLVAIRPTDQRDASGSVIWECKCDCETIVYIIPSICFDKAESIVAGTCTTKHGRIVSKRDVISKITPPSAVLLLRRKQ